MRVLLYICLPVVVSLHTGSKLSGKESANQLFHEFLIKVPKIQSTHSKIEVPLEKLQ